MIATALLLLAIGAPGSEPATACHAALEQAYDGSTGAALVRLAQLNREQPDLLCAYTELLVRAFDLEQQPERQAGDREQLRRAESLIALAEERLSGSAQDPRARFVRGAAYGLESRLHLLRWQKRAAAQTAARMREDLLQVAESDPLWSEAQFGLGLYDYYADVLPRMLKLLRFLTGLPGGDRVRGLEAIELARERAQLHRTEARVQLFDIYAFYEGRDDDALVEMLELRRLYPGAPRWALKLCEHQRERLGLQRESAQTAREILHSSEGGHPNYAPVVGAMARVQLGEALLLDLQPAEASRALEPALRLPLPPDWMARARLALGRSLDLRGERQRAEPLLRAAAETGDKEVRARAQRALREPLSSTGRAALSQLAEGRRLRGEGRELEAASAYARALALDPGSQESALRVAEAQIQAGRLLEAREHIEGLLDEDDPEPAWVRPWAQLFSARLDDLAGRREPALQQYNQVFKHPLGSQALRELAAEGLRHPFRAPSPGASRPPRADHPR